jgi:hypothetical protein
MLAGLTQALICSDAKDGVCNDEDVQTIAMGIAIYARRASQGYGRVSLWAVCSRGYAHGSSSSSQIS